jgi:hypothetical protein
MRKHLLISFHQASKPNSSRQDIICQVLMANYRFDRE